MKRAGFQVSTEAIERLESARVPAKILLKLDPLKEEIRYRDEFETELNRLLTIEELKGFREEILKCCNSNVHYALGTMIMNTETKGVYKFDLQVRLFDHDSTE